MGFRLRRSIKLVPGVRLNVSKTGLGASFGGKHGRYSVHSSGRRTVSASTGVPGVYYQESVRSGRRHEGAPAFAPPEHPVKPGWFAPKEEKELYRAILAADAQAIRKVGDEYPPFRVAAYTFAGILLRRTDPAQARSLLEPVFASGHDPAVDPFIAHYLQSEVTVPIALGVTAVLPLSRDALGLALAELRQADDDLDGAIDAVEQLEPTMYAAVSLAELYLLSGRYDDVIELTDGLANEDDASALLLLFRGSAFRHQGAYGAAHETLKEALRSRSRAPAIRNLALFERAENYLAQGKRAQARKDLERILANDSDYEGVRERLAEVTASS